MYRDIGGDDEVNPQDIMAASIAILLPLCLFLVLITTIRWRRRFSRVANIRTFEIQLPRDDDSS
ncbi:MAG: hypothetical protein JW854_07600, partial [Actinobacteria bacterium]|nr:hypothetical protein [Actinomycetota bacterium]